MVTPDELKAALEKCVLCGRCLGNCPIYRLTGWEGHVARGKIVLLRTLLDGETDLAERMEDLLSHCLLCGACAEGCASGVQADQLIKAGRALALKRGGLDRLRSLLAAGFPLLAAGVQDVPSGREDLSRVVPRESGLSYRFPLPGPGPDPWRPPLAERPFLTRPRPAPGAGSQKVRVALFVGCTANYLRPESAEAAVALLEAAGVTVIVPADQVCCGQPAAGAGDQETSLNLARRNFKALAGIEFDYLTAFCAECSNELRSYGEKFEGGREIAVRVRDLNDLLINVLRFQPVWKADREEKAPLKVFYHDPCHLRRKQGLFQEPRTLLESLPGVELVGKGEPPACCGYGLLFNLFHFDLSRELIRQRMEKIRPYKPDLVTTACSGCWLQFEEGVRRSGGPFKVKPLVEFLAERLGLGPAAGTSGTDH
ncbi:MAG: (Fe-S)-binding protein [Thermodesulfobacteriota bacterium]